MSMFFNGNAEKGGFNVLDLGFAIGEQAEVISSLGNKVIGIDISYNAVSLAQENSNRQNLNTNYLVSDIENLPFKEAAFDICFCGLVLHHFPDLKGAASQIYYALKQKGKLFSCDPNGFNPYEFIAVYIIKSLGGVSWKSRNERSLLPKELYNDFGKVGFQKFRFSTILLYSEKKMSYFYRLRSMIYKTLFRLMPKISQGNMLIMKCEK